MPLVNSPTGYGALTKLFHWLIALLILLQFTSANIMLRTPAEATTLGLGQDTYYNAVGADADATRAEDHPSHRATALRSPPHHATERFSLWAQDLYSSIFLGVAR